MELIMTDTIHPAYTLSIAAEVARKALEEHLDSDEVSVSIRPDLGLVLVYASTGDYMLESRVNAAGNSRHRVNLEWFDSAADIPTSFRKARAIAMRASSAGSLVQDALETERVAWLARLEG
jgi:hypothetical protein